MSQTLPLHPETLREAQAACQQFEAELSAFVDGELDGLDASRVSQHVDDCPACRSFVNSLAGMARLNRGVTLENELESWSADELWGDLTLRLLSDNETRLGKVLYELGKSLIVEALRTTPDFRGLNVYDKKPESIPALSRKGLNLARENRELHTKTARGRSSRGLRHRGLFPNRQRLRGAAAFECGRNCLEESLRLGPDRQEARIYLAQYHRMAGRFDQARKLLKAVVRSDCSPRLQLMALQQLSWVYSSAHQYARAVESERVVLERAERAQDTLFQAGALTNLVIYHVKLRRFDEAEACVQRLVKEFSQYLSEVVAPAFRKAREFRRVLVSHGETLAGWRVRYPELFAS